MFTSNETGGHKNGRRKKGSRTGGNANMGKQPTGNHDESNVKIVRVDETDRGTGTGRSDKSSDSANTNTNSRTGTGTGTATGTDTGTATGVNIEKANELAFLNEDEKKAYDVADEQEKKRLVRNAKRRERYVKEKTAQGKPRRVNKKKQSEPPVNDESLKLMIVTISGLVASRPNMTHWMLSEKEVDSIVKPLSNILKSYDAFSNLGEHSNEIALAMACITIFVPRIFVTINNEKEKKKHAVTGNITDTNVTGKRSVTGEKTDSYKRVDKTDGRQSAVSGTGNVHDVSVYGLPLS